MIFPRGSSCEDLVPPLPHLRFVQCPRGFKVGWKTPCGNITPISCRTDSSTGYYLGRRDFLARNCSPFKTWISSTAARTGSNRLSIPNSRTRLYVVDPIVGHRLRRFDAHFPGGFGVTVGDWRAVFAAGWEGAERRGSAERYWLSRFWQ